MRLLRRHHSWARACALLACLVGMAVCAPAHAAWITKLLGRDTISILGELKPGDDKDFAALLDDKVTQVSIGTMVSANEPVALQIGRLIRQRHLSVKVGKFCLTACAHYIFAAGHDNTIAEGAVVGLHAGIIPLLRLTVSDLQAATPLTEQEAQWTRELLAQYTSILAVQGGEKQAFERDMGLDAALVARMEAATAPHGINLSEVTGQGFVLSGKKGSCDLWVPDREGWRQLGVRVAAFTRPDAPTIARLVKIDASRVSVLGNPMAEANPVWCDNQRAPVEMDVRFNASQQQRDAPPTR